MMMLLKMVLLMLLLLMVMLVQEVLVVFFEYLLENLGRQRVRALDLADRVPLLDRLHHIRQILDFVELELQVRRQRRRVLSKRAKTKIV